MMVGSVTRVFSQLLRPPSPTAFTSNRPIPPPRQLTVVSSSKRRRFEHSHVVRSWLSSTRLRCVSASSSMPSVHASLSISQVHFLLSLALRALISRNVDSRIAEPPKHRFVFIIFLSMWLVSGVFAVVLESVLGLRVDHRMEFGCWRWLLLSFRQR